VVLNEGATRTNEDLGMYCRSRIAKYNVPRRRVVVDSLPRVHGWKLLRRKLRETCFRARRLNEFTVHFATNRRKSTKAF